MRALRSLPILVLIAVTVGGCSATQSTSSGPTLKGEAANVQKTINNLASYAQSRDASSICNKVYAPSLIKTITATGYTCKKIVGDQLLDVDDPTTTVKSVTVVGPKATATVQTLNNGKNKLDTLVLEKEADGSWRIVSLG